MNFPEASQMVHSPAQARKPAPNMTRHADSVQWVGCCPKRSVPVLLPGAWDCALARKSSHCGQEVIPGPGL